MGSEDEDIEEKKQDTQEDSAPKEAGSSSFYFSSDTDLSKEAGEGMDADDEIDEEEKNFLENSSNASKVNVGSILGVLLVIIVGVILFILVFTKLTNKEKIEETTYDSSGAKTPPNIQLGGNKPYEGSPVASTSDYPADEDFPEEDGEMLSDEEVDDILNNLPENMQLPGSSRNVKPNEPKVSLVHQDEPGTAPVRQEEEPKKTEAAPTQENKQPASPAPSTVPPAAATAPASPAVAVTEPTRPDTRNSSSVRKIEGLAGFSNGSYQSSYGGFSGTTAQSSYQAPDPSKMSKEDYIAAQLSAMQQGNGQSSSAFGGITQALDIEQNKSDFFNSGSSSSDQAASGYFLAKNTIWDGTVIKGALQTGINTDNPGVVIARVTENVYSSYDYSYLLIPEGTLLYATYNSSVSYGQDRIQIAWNLLIRPDGYRMELGNMNGVDAQGYSGVKGWKYNHIWEELKAMGMVAMYSILNTEITKDIAKQKNEFISNAMTDVYKTTQDMANGMLERALDIKPSITVSPGTEVKLITNQPLVLPAVELFPVTQKYVRN